MFRRFACQCAIGSGHKCGRNGADERIATLLHYDGAVGIVPQRDARNAQGSGLLLQSATIGKHAFGVAP